MPEERELVEARNVTVYPRQWAVVDAYAKDMGYGSTSAGLRRIIDEWKDFKRYQLGFDLDNVPVSP